MDQLVELLKAYLDPGKDDWTDAELRQLDVLLRFSAAKIIARRYPFDESVTEVPERYQMLQVRIAAELYGKMGGEGETSHSENGISRAWESADVSKGLLEDITPMAGIFMRAAT